VKRSLNYFHRLWSKQQERRENGDKNWQPQFLAADTWKNLRTTCRGFFGYCRSIIDYASKHNSIKLYAVSPAHANSSVIEAWFSLVRSGGQDSATSYCAFVKNFQLRDPNSALKKNSSYAGADAGKVCSGEEIDVRDLINHQQWRNEEKDVRISVYQDSRKTASLRASRAFSIGVDDVSVPEATESELDVLKVLTEKCLRSGYMDELLKVDMFHQWLRLSIDNETDSWFKELLEVTQSAVGSATFDEACQAIMNKLLRITAEIMRKRKSTTASFEAGVHKFYKSAEFDEICNAKLPGTLSKSRPGCVLIGLMLSKLHQDWLTSALQFARRQRNPELFKKKQTTNLSSSDENNEVNSFVGWSIFSALKRYADDDEEENESKRLLLSMIILEEDADEEYMAKYYDTNLSMMNCGGLTLVSKYFFDWGKDAMNVIRNAFTQDRMKQSLRTCFKDGKRVVMEDTSIHSKFVSLCQSQSMSFQQDVVEKVYTIILRKMVHSRFAVVFRRWKEEHCQKHDMALRQNLKAGVDKKKRKQTKQLAAEHPDESAIDIKKTKTSK